MNNPLNILKDLFSRGVARKFQSFSHRTVEQHIEQSTREVQQAAIETVGSCESISNYLTKEEGLLAKCEASLCKLNRSLDATTAETVNAFDKAQLAVDTYEQAELPQHLSHEKAQYQAKVQQLVQKRNIELHPLYVERARTKKRLAEAEANTANLTDQLPKGVATDKNYLLWDVLIIVGMIFLLVGEGASILSALEILRNSVLMELGVTISLILGTLTFSKVCVYGFKRSTMFDSKNEGDEQAEIWDGIWVLSGMLGVAIGIFVGNLRIKYLLATGLELSWLTKAGLYALGIIFFAANTFLYGLYSGKSFTVKRLYSNQVKLEKRNRKNLARIVKKIGSIKSFYLIAYKELQDDYLLRKEHFQLYKPQQLQETLQTTNDTMNLVLSVSRNYKTQLAKELTAILQNTRATVEVKTNTQGYSWKSIEFVIPERTYAFPFLTTPVVPFINNHKNNHIMKTLVQPLIVLFVSTFLLISCGGNHSHQFAQGNEHRIVHIVDHTIQDSGNAYHLSSQQIFDYVGLENNPNNGFNYIGTSINDVSVSPEHTVHLASVNGLLTNALNRRELLQSTQKQLENILGKLYPKQLKHYTQTSFFAPLKRYFDELSRENTPTTILLQSDLLNNTEELSVYHNLDPDEYTAKVKGLVPDSLFCTLDVVVLYQPKTSAEDRLFRNVYYLFKTTLESQHSNIHVSLKANL